MALECLLQPLSKVSNRHDLQSLAWFLVCLVLHQHELESRLHGLSPLSAPSTLSQISLPAVSGFCMRSISQDRGSQSQSSSKQAWLLWAVSPLYTILSIQAVPGELGRRLNFLLEFKRHYGETAPFGLSWKLSLPQDACRVHNLMTPLAQKAFQELLQSHLAGNVLLVCLEIRYAFRSIMKS